MLLEKIKMRVGVIIISYNCHEIFLKQIERINRHCKDSEFEIVIIDNSTKQESIDAIDWYCRELNLRKIKTKATSENGSSSHAFSANASYIILKDSFEFLFYLDHDCFPVKDFSVQEILGDNLFAGIGQGKLKTYLWPGCLMFNNGAIDKELIDFSPNGEFGLDTGGNLYKCLETYPEAIKYFNEVHVQNPEFNKSFYNFYSMINDETFMHFLNSSNWANSKANQERLNSLINILDKK